MEYFMSPIFETYLSEYGKDLDRSRSIDSRSGILLTFLITGFPIYVQTVGTDRLKNIFCAQAASVREVFTVIFFLISVLALLASLVFIILTFSRREFKAYSLPKDALDYEYFKSIGVNHVACGVLNALIEIVEKNKNVVERKSKIYQTSLWSAFAFAASMVATFLTIIL